MKGDLHFHSYYSDGLHGVDFLINRAASLGLGIASLTDHDTFYGCPEFSRLARKKDIIPVSGIELSSFDQTEIHILGYNIDYTAENALTQELSKIQARRMDKFYKIIKKLSEQNITLEPDDFSQYKTRSLGRAHIADAMIKKGVVKNRSEAFQYYLGEGRPCYVEEFLMSPYYAVELINASGGIAVLAHPGRLTLNERDFIKILKKLIAAGLCGIETYYPAHSSDMTDYYNTLANKYNLISTCGSDFHGAGVYEHVCYNVPNRSLQLLKEAP